MTLFLTVREAVIDDASLLLAWRNDEGTRAASRNSSPISQTAHHEWLASLIDDDARLLLIAHRDDEAVGTIRFDSLPEAGEFEISITIAPAFRGEGLAPSILALGEKYLNQVAEVGLILAFIRRDNARSVALFRSAGYVQTSASPEGGFWFAKRY